MTVRVPDVSVPAVSVCVITYNHAAYIRQCLQSIVEQQTDFPFEVLIADNASTDGTSAIVQEFADRYPAIVSAVIREEKISGSANYVLVHDRARGRFVAHMDGDDRALPGKLQKQFQVLERHPDCNAVWHRVNFFNDEGRFMPGSVTDTSVFEGGVVRLDDAIRLGFVGVHSSLMYRRSARLAKNVDRDYLDVYLTWELLSSGSGRFVEEVLGEYRVGAKGSISKNSYAFIRRLVVDHAEDFLSRLPEQRRNFVILAIMNALIDIRNRKSTAWEFVRFVARHPSLVTPGQLRRAIVDYRRLNAPWSRRVKPAAS